MANTSKLVCNGAVGFIDLLGVRLESSCLNRRLPSRCSGRNNELRNKFGLPSVPFGKFAVSAAGETNDQIQIGNHHHDLSAVSTSGISAVTVVRDFEMIQMPAVPVIMIGSKRFSKCRLSRCRSFYPFFTHHLTARSKRRRLSRAGPVSTDRAAADTIRRRRIRRRSASDSTGKF